MHNVCVIVCHQGEMTARDILNECKSGRWLPLLVMRDGDRTILPCFESAKVAFQFAKRNLPPKWYKPFAVMWPTLEDAQVLDQKGWSTTHPLTFPRRLTDVVEFDIEIVEFQEEQEFTRV